METEALRRRLNSALEFEEWTLHNEYKSISVLVIYWKDADMPGFKEEAYSVGALFAGTFRYDVNYYEIPSDDSHMELDRRINTFISEHRDPDDLLIIHYGGHGDPDNETAHEKLAVWAALSQGGSTVDWSIIQPKLGHAKAEVLLLLDCCFAAQAARNSQNRAIPPNLELLAACAMGRKSPPPGPDSFTSHVIRQLRASLAANGSAKISDLALSLAHRSNKYRETPIHFSGLGRGRSTVSLEPLRGSPPNLEQFKRETAWLTLKVSLRDVLSDGLVLDIIQWLKARPSRKVAKLTVEDVVQSTNDMSQFIQDDARGRVAGPMFQQFSPPAKIEVLTAWNEFKSLMTALATQVKNLPLIELPNDHAGKINSDQIHEIPAGPLATLLQMEEGLATLHNIVHRNVMALPDLNKDKKLLLEAIEDPAMQHLGLTPLLDRRLKALFPSDSIASMRIDHSVIETQEAPGALRSLVHEDIKGLGSVLVEYKTYEKSETRLARQQLDQMEERISNLAELLQTRDTSDLHTLKCIQWFHEPERTRFGLVFRYPAGYDGIISLRDLINRPGIEQRSTLAQRFTIIKDVGDALLKWHLSANWVHQGIASHNVYFLKPRGQASFEFSTPYLFGYEFSRPGSGISLGLCVEDFEHNIYRHPNRQGLPSKSHEKIHDLYSFGILMFEVGMWKLARNFFDAEMRKELTPWKMMTIIQRNAKQRLGHHMGAAYQKATSSCLNMELGVDVDDAVKTRLAKAFEDKVLRIMDRGICLD
ncbi:MAG: hypothetical protein LQ350_007736 [Teloschistes chrysophthalmus]|nr:MAG: hypothetical protein LQ350_007736 [Niorma chrysophthalma]